MYTIKYKVCLLCYIIAHIYLSTAYNCHNIAFKDMSCFTFINSPKPLREIGGLTKSVKKYILYVFCKYVQLFIHAL